MNLYSQLKVPLAMQEQSAAAPAVAVTMALPEPAAASSPLNLGDKGGITAGLLSSSLRLPPTSIGANTSMYGLVEGVHVFAAGSASLQVPGHL